MKQTLLMIVLTAMGALGAFVVEPFVGVAVYYVFAVLRPQYLWEWALPQGIGWSGYVAWPTLLATLWMAAAGSPVSQSPDGGRGWKFAPAHWAFFAFGIWISLTYITAVNKVVAWPWFVEYIKLFLMFGVAAYVMRELRHVMWIYRLVTIVLIYIAYEINFMYFVDGRVDIYNRGYGGLDNNGAGLMLAMGIPLALNAWESSKTWWRWGYLLAVPVLLHAVLMSYSRGAMVSLIAATPLLLVRSQRKVLFTLAMVGLLSLVPLLAGNEIRARFFSTEQYESDASANSRFDSWEAAMRIAADNPLFGVGIRNANLLSYQYGADMEGRTIHSQYFQLMADAGYPGLALYLIALAAVWLTMRSTRRRLRRAKSEEARLGIAMLNGLEGALFVFCFGAIFLSLEVFELPYIVALLGAQVGLVTRTVTAPAPVVKVSREFPTSPLLQRPPATLRPRPS